MKEGTSMISQWFLKLGNIFKLFNANINRLIMFNANIVNLASNFL